MRGVSKIFVITPGFVAHRCAGARNVVAFFPWDISDHQESQPALCVLRSVLCGREFIAVMSAARKEEEGRQFLAAAEKKAEAKSGFFKSVLGLSSGKDEEAAELYVKAANSFKLAKAWDLAGDAFERAARTYERSSDLSYEAASKYSDAAKAYKNSSSDRAIAAYDNAIRLYTDAARFQQCARLSKEVAEMHESNKDYDAAITSYEKAADFYDGEDAKSNANTMRKKVAALCANAGNHGKAADLFEKVAADALDNNLLKYSAREYLLQAGICRLCMGDMVGASRAVESYNSMDPSFPSSREGQLLTAILKAVEEGDVDAFTNSVYDYDSMSKLDEWKTAMLLKVKNSMKEAEDDLT